MDITTDIGTGSGPGFDLATEIGRMRAGRSGQRPTDYLWFDRGQLLGPSGRPKDQVRYQSLDEAAAAWPDHTFRLGQPPHSRPGLPGF